MPSDLLQYSSYESNDIHALLDEFCSDWSPRQREHLCNCLLQGLHFLTDTEMQMKYDRLGIFIDSLRSPDEPEEENPLLEPEEEPVDRKFGPGENEEIHKAYLTRAAESFLSGALLLCKDARSDTDKQHRLQRLRDCLGLETIVAFDAEGSGDMTPAAVAALRTTVLDPSIGGILNGSLYQMFWRSLWDWPAAHRNYLLAQVNALFDALEKVVRQKEPQRTQSMHIAIACMAECLQFIMDAQDTASMHPFYYQMKLYTMLHLRPVVNEDVPAKLFLIEEKKDEIREALAPVMKEVMDLDFDNWMNRKKEQKTFAGSLLERMTEFSRKLLFTVV